MIARLGNDQMSLNKIFFTERGLDVVLSGLVLTGGYYHDLEASIMILL